MNTQTQEALKMSIERLQISNELLITGETTVKNEQAIQACKEALKHYSVAELNDEYLRDTYIEGLSQPVAFCKHGVPKGVCRLGDKDCENL